MTPREEIKCIIGHFFEFLCGEDVSEIQAELLMKELLKPTAAYDRFYLTILSLCTNDCPAWSLPN